MKAFSKDVFINKQWKLGAQRLLDTILVLTINYIHQESIYVSPRIILIPYEKLECFGSNGSINIRLKIKGNNGRVSLGVQPMA